MKIDNIDKGIENGNVKKPQQKGKEQRKVTFEDLLAAEAMLAKLTEKPVEKPAADNIANINNSKVLLNRSVLNAMLADKVHQGPRCEVCKTPIQEGKLCSACKNRIIQSYNGGYDGVR